MPIAQFGQFAPDQADLLNFGSPSVLNVIPVTAVKEAVTYGPMSSLMAFSGALTAQCQGAISFQDSGGNVIVFAGDATKLYELTAASTNFVNVSKAGGYTCAAQTFWNFTQYGNYVIATDFNDNIQYFLLGTSTLFADLSATTPRARHLAIIRNFLVTANTFDTTNGLKPQRVWWSGVGDPTSWPVPGTAAAFAVQSDFQDVTGDYGQIQGIVGNLGTADGAIFFERAIVRMNYSGSSAIFDFTPAEFSRGTPSPGSIAQLGSTVFYLATDGFYSFDGTNSTPIGLQRVDKFFSNDLLPTYYNTVTSSVDPINKLVMWAYAGQGSSNGVPNRLLIYSWALDKWSVVNTGVQFLFKTLSFGYTLDQLDPFGTIDTLPFSLDSPAWAGGRLQIGAFNGANQLSYFGGSALAATITTAEQQLSPDKRTYIRNVKPLVDGGTPTVSVGVRNRPGDTVVYGPSVPMDALGNAYQRQEGRYMRAVVNIPAASSWAHAIGTDVDFSEVGER